MLIFQNHWLILLLVVVGSVGPYVLTKNFLCLLLLLKQGSDLNIGNLTNFAERDVLLLSNAHRRVVLLGGSLVEDFLSYLYILWRLHVVSNRSFLKGHIA